MRTILVTGGAGFIGSRFSDYVLNSTDWNVVVLDKLTYAGHVESLPCEALGNRLTFVRGCIGDASLVSSLLAEYQPSSVFNFAAESHVDRSIDSPDNFITTNVQGTGTLLKQSLHYWESLSPARQQEFKFLQISTDEVYGSLGPEGLFTETSPYHPNSPYSASKAAADHLVNAYHHTYGLPTVISNSSNNYGPYQFPEKLVPLMILNALEGKPLPVYGDGLHVRDWLFVTDHCHALRLLAEKGRPGEVYNIGGNAEKTNIEVVKTICTTIDQLCPGLHPEPTESLIEYVADRPGHDRRYAIDASKIARELDWTPSTNFEQGIRLTVQWYRDHLDWVAAVGANQQRERLGLRQ